MDRIICYLEYMQRKTTTNQFGKDFVELMNNSILHKTIENFKKGADAKSTDVDSLVKWLPRQTFVKSIIITGYYYSSKKESL